MEHLELVLARDRHPLCSFLTGLPSLRQRLSDGRTNNEPCGFDGIAALHCCFACAIETSIDDSAVRKAARVMETSGLVIIEATQRLLRCCNRPTAITKSGRSRTSTNRSRMRRSLFWGRG